MKNYLVSAEKKTPEIVLMTTGDLMIVGNSRPEDARSFYLPVFNWLKEFKEQNPPRATLTLDLDYVNSSSIRIVLEILKFVMTIFPDKRNFRVVWFYDKNDLDMLDQGKILEKNLNHTFEFIEKPV